MRKIVVIAGPTAVGKTKYAIEAARHFDGEIVSCDSMQLYKYMDIGSAKPSPEELSMARHHLIDMIDPAEPFSVSQYQKLAREAISDIFSRGKLPIVAGGTGLYLNSILYDMDFGGAPKDEEFRINLEKEAEIFGAEYVYEKLLREDKEAAARIHPNNVKKVIRALEAVRSGNKIQDFKKCTEKCKEYDRILIGLTRNRDELYDRINKRVDLLVEEGLFKEVEELLERCGLEKEYADRYPHQVSGGQCQRAAIARALAVNPSILICDEATSALDVTVQKQILELLIELKKKENLSFILICHDLALVQAFCDRVLVLYHGKTVESGTLDETIDHPKMDYTRKLIDSVL